MSEADAILFDSERCLFELERASSGMERMLTGMELGVFKPDSISSMTNSIVRSGLKVVRSEQHLVDYT